MSKQTINIGASPNDGTGTPLRTSFDYTNQNFTELYTALGGGVGLPGATTQVIFNDGGTNLAGDAGLVYNKTTDALTVAGALGAAGLNVTGATIPANGVYLAGTNTLGFSANTLSQYSIAPLGVFQWYNGAGGTRMVLNSTGLLNGGTTADIVSVETTTLTNIGNIGASHGASTGTYFVAKVNAENGIVELKADARSGAYPPMVFTTSATQRMQIDAAGTVGIGVTPSAWNTVKAIQVGYASIYGLSGFDMGIQQNAYYSSGWKYAFTGGAAAQIQLDGGNIKFLNAPSGTAGNAITFTQAMTLDASGNLLVGKTANYGAGETNTLQLKSSVIFASDNTGSASNRNWSIGTNVSGAGNMEWTISSTNTGIPNFAYRMQLTSAGDVNNTTGTYGTISDLRLKENISDARNYLADLLKLRVVKYSLKEESSAVATKLGFIAQEVEQVFPNLVDQSDKEYEGAEGIRSVKTSILIPMLLKAIQELTARVQTLEAR